MQMYKGRIIGVIVGFLILNIIGAIIGYFIGANYDKKRIMASSNRNYNNSYSSQQDIDYDAIMYDFIFAMLGFIAKSSGRVDEGEILKAKHVMENLGFSSYERSNAISSFNRGKSSYFDYGFEIQKAKENGILSGKNPYEMCKVFAFMAFDNGSIDAQHDSLIKDIAQKLYVSPSELQSIYAEMTNVTQSFSSNSSYSNNNSYSNNQNSYHEERESRSSSSSSSSSSSRYEKYCEACFLLDVDPNSEFEDIRRAYKKAIFKYHPDKIAGKDLPPETKKLYEKRANEIQEAFDLIKEYHNKS